MAGEAGTSVDLRTDVAHTARVYDYLVGGTTNYPADRAAGDQLRSALPHVPATAVQNRAFRARAARHAAGEGVRQFLDLGSGIPTSPNLHEIVQAIAPESRVVYVDQDPIVRAHAEALLAGNPRGRTAYLDADLREPKKILDSPELRDTLDLTRPVALSLTSVMHFVPDEDDPYGIVRAFVEALPSGSYLAMTHGTNDLADGDTAPGASTFEVQGITMRVRTRAEVAAFFDGLDLVDPGVVPLHEWHPDAGTPTGPFAERAGRSAYAAVGRKR
jgi:hypothetical protein